MNGTATFWGIGMAIAVFIGGSCQLASWWQKDLSVSSALLQYPAFWGLCLLVGVRVSESICRHLDRTACMRGSDLALQPTTRAAQPNNNGSRRVAACAAERQRQAARELFDR